MPKSAASEELILSIESGIKKEVSVGCSMSESYCSVCGQPVGTCQHRKGRTYRKNGAKVLCYFDLCSPTDAFEWSFVAVPAQPMAGVVKAYSDNKEFDLGLLTKSTENGEVTLTAKEAEMLSEHFKKLQRSAEAAGEFLHGRKASIIKVFLPTANESAVDVFMKALDMLSPEELFKLYCEGEAMNEKAASQLMRKPNGSSKSKQNSFFII